MKILHIISSINPALGGPVEGIKQLYKPMLSLGAQVEIACADRATDPWVIDCHIPVVHALGPKYFKYGYAPRLFGWLRDNVWKYDAVIVNGIWEYHSFAAWRSLSNSSVPYFVFTHGMLDPWFRQTYPIKHLKKCLYWPWATYRLLRDARAVVFTCDDERLLARQSFSLYKVNEAVTMYGTLPPPNDVDRLKHLFYNEYSELHGKRLILFLSRIQKKKACDILIKAFADVARNDSSLHLIMAGPDQEGWAIELKNIADGLGIADRISWTGMLSGDLKWGAFYSAEVFILPSHQENFGIVVAEALACGKPVLISNKVNIWREIEAGGCGFVSDDTVDGTVRNLSSWLGMSSQSYNEMALSAKRTFEEKFNMKSAAHSLLRILRS